MMAWNKPAFTLRVTILASALLIILPVYLVCSTFITLLKLCGMVVNIGMIAATYDTTNTNRLTMNNGPPIMSPNEEPSGTSDEGLVVSALNSPGFVSNTHFAGQFMNPNPGRVKTHVEMMRKTP